MDKPKEIHFSSCFIGSTQVVAFLPEDFLELIKQVAHESWVHGAATADIFDGDYKEHVTAKNAYLEILLSAMKDKMPIS